MVFGKPQIGHQRFPSAGSEIISWYFRFFIRSLVPNICSNKCRFTVVLPGLDPGIHVFV
jgi:hypothetical protein